MCQEESILKKQLQNKKTMKFLKYMSIVLFVFTLMSCAKEDSIQQLYVDSETNDNYLMLDIPASIITLSEDASTKEKQAYESIDKVNLLVFKINESNKDNYTTEYTKVKKILKNKNYTELMRVNSNGYKITAKYVGNEDSINELILFVSDNSKGFAVVRVLGDDMKPENMLHLLNNLKDIDQDNADAVFGKLKDFL